MVERTKKGFLTKRQRKALEEECKALTSFINHRDRWQKVHQNNNAVSYKYVSNYAMVEEEIK